MHLLRMFFVAWLELGIVTLFFLFWLCKRTAKRVNTVSKPILDQDTLQQLLAAAYTLQEQNRYPVKETKADYARTVSLPVESIPMSRPDVELLLPLNDSAVPSARDRRTLRSDEFFWKIATGVAMAALFILLLVTSLGRLSPLPAGKKLVQQEVQSHNVLPQSSGAAAKTIMNQPETTRINNSVVADKPGRSTAAPSHKTIVNSSRHSIYESEADMVAPDTVMRYGGGASLAP